LVSCRECGLVYTNPRPVPSERSRYYPHLAYPEDPSLAEKLEILDSHIRKGRALDVGCGRAFFLNSLKKRFEVMGIEIDKESAALAEREFDISVFKGEIADFALNGDPFDLITFWHSLEHMPDPKAALKKAHALLKKRGFLIIAVPNLGSVQARLFRSRWYHLDVPRHLYHFSKETLSRMIEDSGFSLVDTASTLYSHNFAGYWRSFFNVTRVKHELTEKSRMQKAVDPRWYLSKVLGCVFYLPASILPAFERKKGKLGTLVIVATK
jgi:2-polyprenyl-3-methyl-5-hydroxy-6-metoxy-1,4-benzoquinol methylase